MIKLARYANALLLLGLAVMAIWLLLWQQPSWQWQTPSATRFGYAAGMLVAWLTLVAWQLYCSRRQYAPQALLGQAADWLVAYASQTGFAEQLAEQSATNLRAAGQRVDLLSFQQLRPQALQGYAKALFVVSTTGEGDAPDEAVSWPLSERNDGVDLSALRYGLLALGDQSYAEFCAFGRRLDDWLQDGSASPLFARVEMSNGDGEALASWQQRLGQLSPGASFAAEGLAAPDYQTWHLSERHRLPDEVDAGACFYLSLTPENIEHLAWQAGDIVRIALPRIEGGSAERPYRDYSIASLPTDGRLQLLIRQRHFEGGTLGAGSAYLTQQLGLGTKLELSIRHNPRFHLPEDNHPLILIGNGTGIAGLRALLKARIARGGRDNWLIFGARSAMPKGYYRDDLERWQQAGFLARRDSVYSRDVGGREYVQDRLYKVADALRDWVTWGAAIYVCGSRQGMASDVDRALSEILGQQAMEALRQNSRYRRDVY